MGIVFPHLVTWLGIGSTQPLCGEKWSRLLIYLVIWILGFEKELAVSDVASSKEGIRARRRTGQTDRQLDQALSFRLEGKLSWHFGAETTRLSVTLENCPHQSESDRQNKEARQSVLSSLLHCTRQGSVLIFPWNFHLGQVALVQRWQQCFQSPSPCDNVSNMLVMGPFLKFR